MELGPRLYLVLQTHKQAHIKQTHAGRHAYSQARMHTCTHNKHCIGEQRSQAWVHFSFLSGLIHRGFVVRSGWSLYLSIVEITFLAEFYLHTPLQIPPPFHFKFLYIYSKIFLVLQNIPEMIEDVHTCIPKAICLPASEQTTNRKESITFNKVFITLRCFLSVLSNLWLNEKRMGELRVINCNYTVCLSLSTPDVYTTPKPELQWFCFWLNA